MLKSIYIKSIIALSLFILILSCSKDSDPDPVHEEEVITLVTLEVTKVGSSETKKYNFEVEGHDHGEEDHDETTIMTIMTIMMENILKLN